MLTTAPPPRNSFRKFHTRTFDISKTWIFVSYPVHILFVEVDPSLTFLRKKFFADLENVKLRTNNRWRFRSLSSFSMIDSKSNGSRCNANDDGLCKFHDLIDGDAIRAKQFVSFFNTRQKLNFVTSNFVCYVEHKWQSQVPFKFRDVTINKSDYSL